MKKNSFSHNKNRRNKTPLIPTKNNNNKSIKETKNEIIPIIDLLKCPVCKNICLMNMDRDKLLFSFECNSKHKVNLTKSKTYINSDNNLFNSNISDINYLINNSYIINQDNNISNMTGTNEPQKLNESKKKYINENDFSCAKHPNSSYEYYCYDCEKNICNDCINDHLNHNKVVLTTIMPKENEVINYKNDIKKEEDKLNNIIEKMMKWKKEFEYGLNTIIKIMQNISNLRHFIIMNYDLKQSNQNYNYIQNFNNMKVLNAIFPELQEFVIQKKWKKKGYILIDAIINIQEKIVQNREKLKVMKLKEEIDKKTAILKKQMEIQEKQILKSKKIEINSEENEDIDSIATTNSNQRKNFNTTFNSDCINNNYFCRNVSRRVINSKNIKKKMIEKRNKNKNENNLSHTIEQNKELEKELINENKNIINEENKKEEESNLDSRIKKVDYNVETTFNNNNKNIDNKEENQIINNNLDSIGHNLDNTNNINNENNLDNENYLDNEKIDNIENLDINDCITEINNKLDYNENDYNTIENNKELEKIQDNQNIDNGKINVENIECIKVDIRYDNDQLENKEKNQNKIEVLRNKPEKIYNNIETKYELTNTDMIRSIEFTKNNHVLICTLENLGIYKINQNYELEKIYDIKEFNYRMNYCSQLSNGNLVICSLNSIDIINFFEDNDLISHTLNQQLKGKNNSYNINKVIEIRKKNYLISCDKNNIIIFSKNNETNSYQEMNCINTKSEVKCLEQIDENRFVTVEPEEQCLIFYEIENLQKNILVNDIQSSYGRYAISFIPQNNCIYVTGRQGIYIISTKTFQKINFFIVNEWISSINYDCYNDYLICGTWKKDYNNEEKTYNLILYKVEENNLSFFERKNNIHSHDIVVIKPSEEGFILTGSNDRTVKLWT